MSERPISTATASGDTPRNSWGLALPDGSEWDAGEYVRGVELTDDCMVLVAFDKVDAINGFMWPDMTRISCRPVVVEYVRRDGTLGWFQYPDALVFQEIEALAHGRSDYRRWLETHPEAAVR